MLQYIAVQIITLISLITEAHYSVLALPFISQTKFSSYFQFKDIKQMNSLLFKQKKLVATKTHCKN